jgi:hypothetical protein
MAKVDWPQQASMYSFPPLEISLFTSGSLILPILGIERLMIVAFSDNNVRV